MSPRDESKPSLQQIMAVSGIIVMLIAILLPSLISAAVKEGQLAGLAKLRQVGQVVSLYDAPADPWPHTPARPGRLR